jgi:hypothetical protein
VKYDWQGKCPLQKTEKEIMEKLHLGGKAGRVVKAGKCQDMKEHVKNQGDPRHPVGPCHYKAPSPGADIIRKPFTTAEDACKVCLERILLRRCIHDSNPIS